jgi:hypothetical protein
MQTFGWPEAYFILRAAGWTLALTAIAFVIGSLSAAYLRDHAPVADQAGCAASPPATSW